MSYRTPSPMRMALGAILALAVTACDQPVDPVGIEAPDPSFGMHAQVAAGGPELAQVRRLTAPFHRLEAAMAAGWSDQITPCLEDPVEGGMGFHYANLEYFDGEANLLEPETLVYAPWRNGEVRLVAVEYIVPLDAWAGQDPPELLGQHFHRNDAVGIWALHVWLWQHNPNGMFADWNPRIAC